MSPFISANIGSYPRIGEDQDQKRHRRGRLHFEAKAISAHALRDVEESVTQEIIHEQILCGVDEVTDGLIRWNDPIGYLCRNVSGMTAGPLRRFLSTPLYYRVPILPPRPRVRGPLLHQDFRIAQEHSLRPVRAVLTGPLTLAHATMGSSKTLERTAARADFFADLVSHEIRALAKAGAKRIQLDEPAVLWDPNLAKQAPKIWRTLLTENANVPIVLSIGLANPEPLMSRLFDVPFQGFQLDGTFDLSSLLAKFPKNSRLAYVGLGVVDCLNTKPESLETIQTTLAEFSERTGNDQQTAITPSGGLEFLPRDVAAHKLRLCAQLRDRLNASSSLASHG